MKRRLLGVLFGVLLMIGASVGLAPSAHADICVKWRGWWIVPDVGPVCIETFRTSFRPVP